MKSIWVWLLLVARLTVSGVEEKDYTEPLGIGLEGIKYPYAVRFLELEASGEKLRMAFMDVNPAGERAVVLLHGKNFYGAYWEPLIKALENAGYRVVVPDQIGFGKSSKPDMAYSFDWLAENTKSLLEKLGIKKAAVVAHSMGGMLAVRFARSYPEVVTHLILANPIGLEDYREKVPPVPMEKLLAKELSQTNTMELRKFFKAYVVDWKPEAFEPFVETRVRVTQSGEYPRWAAASARTYAMIYQQPVRHEFHLLSCPTLLVIGQADRTTIGRDQVSAEVGKTLGNYPELGRKAAHDIPGAKLVELDAVGHIPHLEATERFNKEVLSFLK